MRILMRSRKAADEVVYVPESRPRAESHELIFTSEQQAAWIWSTSYAAADFICKSGTELKDVEIIQLEDEAETE